VFRRAGKPEGGDDLAGRTPRDRFVRVLATDQTSNRRLDSRLRPTEVVVRLGLEILSL
jgi:hypothetical protein